MMASAFVICLLLIFLLACCQVTSGQHCFRECKLRKYSKKFCRSECIKILSSEKTATKRKEMYVATENKREKDKISGEIAAIARLLRISLQNLAKTNQDDKDHDIYSIL